jgi:chromosome partitioning protein
MATIVSCLSQKGGVTKTTMARLLAHAYASAGWKVKICDFDLKQKTATEWGARRLENARKPEIEVQGFAAVAQALAQAPHYDMLVCDGRGFADTLTLELAQASDAIFLPSGLANDDLAPTIRLAHELKKAGVPARKLAVVLARTGDSAREIDDARDYVAQAGYKVLTRTLPERQGYRLAHDAGRAAGEATHFTLRIGAKNLADEMADHITANTKDEA